jgi:hypothetical protein
MADTLKGLAGAAFRDNDVISAMHAPLTPEQIVLDRYVFLPHARTGIAAALSTPFAWRQPARASVKITVPVNDDRGALNAEMLMHVFGPADVLELDPRQVIRTFPKADSANAEVDDLAHVEFDRPDLPWLFTPAGPDGMGHLVPWITLVAAERRHLEWGERRGAVRLAQIRRDQLQPLGDAWAWAHAQVTGAKPAAPNAEPTLEQRLSEANAAHNLSRLVCPRRLDVQTHYVACVVPTFLAGAQAAMGLAPVKTLEPAWGSSANFAAGDPWDMVSLPVFFSWEFATGEAGNFESLARRLKPAIAPHGVGRRRVDAARPWLGEALDAGDPGAEIVVEGPMVSPQGADADQDLDRAEPPWPDEAQQHWSAAVTAELVAKLNRPDEQAHLPNPGPPLVGPPLYGGVHAKQALIETDAAAAAQPPWFRELNIDPRNRVVGGLGTRVVQAEQEDLMLSAWNQVERVEAANRAFRMAQLAQRVGASLHRRHFSRLSDAGLLGMTERVHAKVLAAPARTVWAELDDSSLPRTVTTGAFRRLTRVRGPVLRAAMASLDARRGAADALAVAIDRLTTSWVLPYASPDGITGLSATATARITPQIAAEIDPAGDRDALVQRWRDALARPGAPDLLNPAGLHPPATVGLSHQFLTSVLQRLLRAAPTFSQMQQDPLAALSGATRAALLQVVVEIAAQQNIAELPVSAADARRLQLPVQPAGNGPPNAAAADLRAFAQRMIDAAHSRHVALPGPEVQRRSDQLRAVAANRLSFPGAAVAHALAAIGRKVVLDDPFADPPRARLSVAALGLLQKLDPRVTVPARVIARLKAGSGRFPAWLRPDWFDDHRIEPVMACPVFNYPMYEPLYRYDRDWMIPGLGKIQKPEMATLLQTNSRFIEAYLVGLNHAMARELLWRDYPTDQRGTCFSSFWTGDPELIAKLHEPAWAAGSLGQHVKPELEGQLVFLARGELIRRYPGVVAHAAREAASDHGVPIFEEDEADSPAHTLFQIILPPNVLVAGFTLTKARATQAGETWWFTLSENPTEPRFGLDPSRQGPIINRDNLSWDDFGVLKPGQFLSAGRGLAVPIDDSRWGASSAQMAYLLFRLPARAAFRAAKMIAGAHA